MVEYLELVYDNFLSGFNFVQRLFGTLTKLFKTKKSAVHVVTETSVSPPDENPIVISRDRHPISRKNIDQDALKVLYRLHRNGYLAYLVGGGVRDLLLGKKPKDFDVGTNASPRDIKRLFSNSFIIGKRFRIAHIRFRDNKIIEVTTFRKKSEEDTNRSVITGLPSIRDNTFGTPREDALRRDITINGIFYNIADFSILDYVGGLKDLEDGIIRIIGDPRVRFIEDPVRMIRVIRHAARTGYTIEKNTDAALRELHDKISLCSPSRIHEELLKDLKSGYSRKAFELFRKYGLLGNLFPTIDRFISEGKISALTFFSILDYVDTCVASGKQLSVPFLFAAPLFPNIVAITGNISNAQDQQGVDFPRIIQKHLIESLQPVGVSKKNVDTIRQLLYLSWRMFQTIEKGFIPFSVRKKSHFGEAFELLGLVVRAYGHFSNSAWPVVSHDGADPLAKLLRASPSRRRRRGRSRPRPAQNSS